MEVIHKNESSTVGICYGIPDLKNIGAFKVSILKEWMELAEIMYGENTDLMLSVKRSENPTTDAYVLCISEDGEDPFVCCTGKFPVDGKNWEGDMR